MPPLLATESRSRRLLLALGVYLFCGLVFALVAGKERLSEHTSYNHYAHLADAWLHGRQNLVNGPPAYAGGNDFAQFDGKTYISFPPFPAVVMMPFVALAGSPEKFQDGQFVIAWLAGIGPALLFLALEKLRRSSRSERSENDNVTLALLFAFGTVYFFTAVEGTVWFSAHVVAVGLMAGFVLTSLGASTPVLAGLFLSCAWMTRPAMLLAAPFFAYEALRASRRISDDSEGNIFALDQIDLRMAARKVALFSAPLLISFAIGSYTNYTRFRNPSPFAFGHEYLTVAWKARMDTWGLFHWHYLSKNLGAMLTVLPWLPAKGSHAAAPFQINEHGLALWFTTPFYLWLFWPRRRNVLYVVVAVVAGTICLLDLLYQNSGWRQFGYRFSNDYAVLLFVLLALGGASLKGPLFRAAALWAVAWNLFGAITFDRNNVKTDAYYFRDGSQTILYQPD